MNMRIGIDIDGVLTDIEQWQLDYASKFYYENYNKIIVDYKGYETNEIFNTGQECDDLFWNKYFEEYSTDVKTREFASEIIDKLKADGNEIYIITARGSSLSKFNDTTKLKETEENVINWLNKNNIHYDKLIFSAEDKLAYCINNNIDLMVEDKTDNINKISTKIPVICFNANYNEDCNGDNITRCFSWYDLYAKFIMIINS
ncbi:MAG: uncharacterized protein PWQ10_558 [Patescibacteria group bacterium]|nr:uncharacterized protein [Patescibacteria group bacterium]